MPFEWIGKRLEHCSQRFLGWVGLTAYVLFIRAESPVLPSALKSKVFHESSCYSAQGSVRSIHPL